MTDTTINPRAAIGDNAPDFAAIETSRLEGDYADLGPKVSELLDEARAIPAVIDDRETALRAGAIVKRISDVTKRLEEIRKVEGEPHLRRGNAVNAFFFGFFEKLQRRNKTDRPGAADVLNARISDYQDRVRVAEEAERRRVAEEERKKAEAARLAAEEAARKVREAEEAAARARKPENKAAKQEEAAAAERAAMTLASEAAAATDRAQEAHIQTLAKPADMVRDRGDDGVLLTSKREAYAIITDAAKLDKEALWPFIGLDAKEKALRAWAKNNGHATPMPGAEVGFRNKGVVR